MSSSHPDWRPGFERHSPPVSRAYRRKPVLFAALLGLILFVRFDETGAALIDAAMAAVGFIR